MIDGHLSVCIGNVCMFAFVFHQKKLSCTDEHQNQRAMDVCDVQNRRTQRIGTENVSLKWKLKKICIFFSLQIQIALRFAIWWMIVLIFFSEVFFFLLSFILKNGKKSHFNRSHNVLVAAGFFVCCKVQQIEKSVIVWLSKIFGKWYCILFVCLVVVGLFCEMRVKFACRISYKQSFSVKINDISRWCAHT